MVLNDFLVYLGGVGAVVAISWLFEYFGWFQKTAAKQKQLIFFGVCSISALGAYSVKTYVPAEVIDQITPFFQIVAVIFSYVFLSDKFHAATKLDK